jgi:hypothetical protein
MGAHAYMMNDRMGGGASAGTGLGVTAVPAPAAQVVVAA